MQENYLTSFKAAEMLGISYQKFLGLVKSGQVKPLTRLNGFTFIFDKNELLNNDGPRLKMLYGIKDVMERTGRCKNTVWNYVLSGKLSPSVKLQSIKGKGFQYGFTEDDIARFQANFIPNFRRD